MAEKEFIKQNNNKKDKKGSILRHILKVKEELIELPEDLVLTDRMDGGSSCETITLDDDFTPRNEENICKCRQETFSDDSLEDSGNSTEGIDVKNVGDAKQQRTNLVGSLRSTNLKVTGEKSFKKPSMIPKLSRNSKLRENVNTNSIEQKYLHKNTSLYESKKCQNVKTDVKNTNLSVKNTNLSLNSASNCEVDIPPMKITSLQQKLKATTSIIKQKMEYGNPKDGNIGRNKPRFTQSNSSSALIGQEKPQNTLGTLYRNIVQIRETALALSKSDNFKNQKGHIEKLFKTISEIQNIADKLAEMERKQDKFISKLNTVLVEKLPSQEKPLQNKVRLNMFPKLNNKEKPLENPKKTLKYSQKSSNLKRKPEDFFGKFKDSSKGFKKKKEDNLDKCLSNIIENGELKSIYEDDSKIFNDKNQKNLEDIQNIDSMDGIFIPACEPPPITEEYYEIDGLENYSNDLSLLEFKNLLYKSASNSSLRISDISTEAMKTLKRCPKDFTLRMDFIQGKMLFQSTKTMANNVSFGPDLKFTEIAVDEKKSDVISIKPSTECSFASQLISVDSYKSLKTTDSEIFNAVNLPLVYSNKSRNALSIRSCGAFYKNDSWSVVFLTKQNVTSMPEITGAFEDAIVENINGSDVFQIRHTQKRRRNRGKQTRNNMLFSDIYQEVN